MAMTKTVFRRIGGLLTGEKVDGRRNNFFVEKEFQRSFILFFLVIVSLLIIFSGAAYFVMLRNVLEESIYVIHPRFKGTTEVLTFNLVLFFVEVSVIFFVIIIMTVDMVMRRISKALLAYERIAGCLAALDFRRAKASGTKLFPRLHGQYMDLIDRYSADICLLKEKVIRMHILLEMLGGPEEIPGEKKNAAMAELLELDGAVKAKMAEYKLDDCR